MCMQGTHMTYVQGAHTCAYMCTRTDPLRGSMLPSFFQLLIPILKRSEAPKSRNPLGKSLEMAPPHVHVRAGRIHTHARAPVLITYCIVSLRPVITGSDSPEPSVFIDGGPVRTPQEGFFPEPPIKTSSSLNLDLPPPFLMPTIGRGPPRAQEPPSLGGGGGSRY